jgi:hypothetical protein
VDVALARIRATAVVIVRAVTSAGAARGPAEALHAHHEHAKADHTGGENEEETLAVVSNR